MKNLFLLTLFVFISAVFYNCAQQKTTTSARLKPAEDRDKTRYPNEDSELAILMRQMYEDSEKMRNAAIENKLPDDFRAKFKDIHTATPTEKRKDPKTFKKMSANFMKSMDRVYAGNGNAVQNYNAMINSCIACHASVCPGPLVRIKKLTISDTK